MKAERVILSFIAIVIGLVAAGGAFYLYQVTKTLPAQKSKPVSVAQTTIAVSPTPDGNNLLSVDNPKDEDVSSQKIITINGKTVQGATVIVSSEDTDQVVKPASNGTFSLTMTLPDGTTLITITSVLPDGQEKKITRTVTYSSENF